MQIGQTYSTRQMIAESQADGQKVFRIKVDNVEQNGSNEDRVLVKFDNGKSAHVTEINNDISI